MPWFGVMHTCINAKAVVARGATCSWQSIGDGKKSSFINYGGFPMV